jgi:DNA-binding response OmpR family regulator
MRFLILPRSPSDDGHQAEWPPIECLLSGDHQWRRVPREAGLERDLEWCDVILLEVRTGEDVLYCQKLRSQSFKPLLLYGRNVPTQTWVQGLEQGADAFLPLSASEEVLKARLQALLRRFGTGYGTAA